ncbi:unnamed protein product, partial [Symbiodinium necroappetens]
ESLESSAGLRGNPVVGESKQDASSCCSCGRGLLVAVAALLALGAFLFRQPIRCDQISATFSSALAPAIGAPALTVAEVAPTAPPLVPQQFPATQAAPQPQPVSRPTLPLEAPPAFVMRGKDPCVPVGGAKVIVGPREEFEYVPSAF